MADNENTFKWYPHYNPKIYAYTPCGTLPEAKKLIAHYQKILKRIGINDDSLWDQLDDCAEPLMRQEGGSYHGWYDIESSDLNLSVCPSIQPFAKSGGNDWSAAFTLSFRYYDLIQEADSQFGNQDYYLPSTSTLLWNLIRFFSADLGSEGVYLTPDPQLTPWDVFDTDVDSDDHHRTLWRFYMAFVPNDLLHIFANPPDYISSKRLKDGVGFISHGTDLWHIVWPELPWNPD